LATLEFIYYDKMAAGPVLVQNGVTILSTHFQARYQNFYIICSGVNTQAYF